MVEKIQEVVVDNDYQVTFKMAEPDGSLLYNLAQGGSSMFSEAAVTAAGDKYAENPIGTGPMKYVEWVPNDHITLERFDDYYAGAAKAKTITWRTIPEGSSRAIALENGEVDPSYKTLCKLEKLFHRSHKFLFGAATPTSKE